MKAAIFDSPGGPERLRIVDLPRPEPGPNEVLVRVRATALNRVDILQRQGKYGPPPGTTAVLGLEASGVVESLGPSAQRWSLGDRVFGLLAGGSYAEFVVFHEDLLMRMPDTLSFSEAAAVPETFLTAFQALVLIGRLQEHETALIHAGASGVGTAAIQIARSLRADVIVTASAGKHDICVALGASRAIDYRSEDFAKSVLEHTADRGVDVVVDFIGAPYISQNIRCSAVDGRIVLLALMGGARIEGLSLGDLFRKRLTITASTLRNRSLVYKKELVRQFADAFLTALANREIAPVIDSEEPLENVVEAHRRMEANRNAGKIVLLVS